MGTLSNWIYGELTSSERVGLALAPAFVLMAWAFLPIPFYWLRVRLHGHYKDPELEGRPASLAIGMPVRLYFAWVTRPVWWLLLRSKIPPNAITMLSLLLAVGSGVALAAGRFALGGWLYLFAGTCDFFDGRVARAAGKTTRSGAALDSILDRYCDSAVLMGLAWFYRDSWVLFAVLMALLGTSLVPYIKAKGESVGLNVDIGMMQRAERILYLGMAAAMSPILEVVIDPNDPRPMHRLAVAGIVLLAVSTNLTALQRFAYVLGALSDKPRARWLSVGQGAPARNMVAAAVATAADFLMVTALVGSAGFSPPTATALGCVAGAVVNFSANRMWAFGNHDPALPQAARYVFVSLSSALLNAGGVAVLLLLPALDYRIVWWLVRSAVFVTWNFPLHRDYVFGSDIGAGPAAERA